MYLGGHQIQFTGKEGPRRNTIPKGQYFHQKVIETVNLVPTGREGIKQSMNKVLHCQTRMPECGRWAICPSLPCNHTYQWPPRCVGAEKSLSRIGWDWGSCHLWWWYYSPHERFASPCLSSHLTSSGTNADHPSAAWPPSYEVFGVSPWSKTQGLSGIRTLLPVEILDTAQQPMAPTTHSSCSFSSRVRLFSIRSP
jgi:hypothetical protein